MLSSIESEKGAAILGNDLRAVFLCRANSGRRFFQDPFDSLIELVERVYIHSEKALNNTQLFQSNMRAKANPLQLYTEMMIKYIFGDGDITQTMEREAWRFHGRSYQTYPLSEIVIKLFDEGYKNFKIQCKEQEYKWERILKESEKTRKILEHTHLLNQTDPADKEPTDIIEYFMTCKPDLSIQTKLTSLYNLGFISGVRAERARRNGTAAPNKMYVGYISTKKRKRYEKSRNNRPPHTTE